MKNKVMYIYLYGAACYSVYFYVGMKVMQVDYFLWIIDAADGEPFLIPYPPPPGAGGC